MNSQTFESGRLLLGLSRSGSETTLRRSTLLSRRSLPRLTRLGDVAAMLGGIAVSYLAAGCIPASLPAGCQVVIGIVAVLTGAVAATRFGAYRVEQQSSADAALLRMAGLGLGGLTAAACALLLPVQPHNALAWPVCWVLSSGVLAVGLQVAGGKAFPRLLASGRFGKRVVVVGANQYSAAFVKRLRRSDDLVQVVGIFDDLEDGAESPVPVSGRVEDLLTQEGLGRVDAVILAIPLTETDRIKKVSRTLQAFAADIYLMAGPASLHFGAEQISAVGASPVVNICPRPLDRWQALQKSVFDRGIAAALLLVLAPVLLGVALAVKLTSPGPILFSQPRLGFNNRMFRIYKFRTMYVGDTDLLADRQTTRGDPRVTRVGAILRRFSLDELPQIWNVLDGTMSLVGPRPHAPNTKAGNVLFHDAVSDYPLRHRVKPGITGWAQVNGWRGETRSVEQIRQRVAFDLHYIDNWSMPLDLRIIFLTIRREIFSSTAF